MNREHPVMPSGIRLHGQRFCCLFLAVFMLFMSLAGCSSSPSPSGTAGLLADPTGSADGVPTPETAPGPTPVPEPEIRFTPDAEKPFPAEGVILPLGQGYDLGGVITSNLPLESVSVSVSCERNAQPPYPYERSVRLPDGTTEYRLDGNPSLSSLVDFSEFMVGIHTLTLSAACRGYKQERLLTCRFVVAGPDWEEISEANFPDSYPEALAFFGSEERFLYRYQWVEDRYILADPEWEKTYITQMPGLPEGEMWRVHVDAVPYLEKAMELLDTSLVRVHGTNGDTGILRASDLISTYNGCYVSRFTSSKKWISHHSFGTAIDINARMDPNKNEAENKELIQKEVREQLQYNGILEEDGLRYYDFSYSGSYDVDRNGVPQTCVNYLLYELGFFRAGFGWAHYYKASSDGMHFCLSEFITYDHEDPVMGLRKVFEYADPQELPEGYQPARQEPEYRPEDKKPEKKP